MNAYKISKINEDSNLHSNLQWSASVLVTFQSLLQRIVVWASPESYRSPLWPRHLNGRLCYQDAAADVKTDSNPKQSCLDCMVDAAWNPTSEFRASASHCTNMWPGIFLMKENYLPSEFVFSFFANGIANFDYHIAVNCTAYSLPAFQVLLMNNSTTIPPNNTKT